MCQKKRITDQLENFELDIEKLRRMGVTTAAGRYFTGMWLEREKIRNREKYGRPRALEAERYIANVLNIAPVSVRKHAQFARALETIRKKDSDLVAQVLSGKRSLAVKKAIAMAEAEMRKKGTSIRPPRKTSGPQVTLDRSQRFPMQNSNNLIQSVKDMPAYDPDAELTGLALTVPSWVGSIKRVKSKGDLDRTSNEARAALIVSLSQLQEHIVDMLRIIEEN